MTSFASKTSSSWSIGLLYIDVTKDSKVENENNHNSTITNNKISFSSNNEGQRYSSPYNEWILWTCGQ